MVLLHPLQLLLPLPLMPPLLHSKRFLEHHAVVIGEACIVRKGQHGRDIARKGKKKRARRLGGEETALPPRGERRIFSAIEVVSASRNMVN